MQGLKLPTGSSWGLWFLEKLQPRGAKRWVRLRKHGAIHFYLIQRAHPWKKASDAELGVVVSAYQLSPCRFERVEQQASAWPPELLIVRMKRVCTPRPPPHGYPSCQASVCTATTPPRGHLSRVWSAHGTRHVGLSIFSVAHPLRRLGLNIKGGKNNLTPSLLAS